MQLIEKYHAFFGILICLYFSTSKFLDEIVEAKDSKELTVRFRKTVKVENLRVVPGVKGVNRFVCKFS
jgi:hypothetical protein